MYAFEYHRPETLSDAVAGLANPDAKVAGWRHDSAADHEAASCLAGCAHRSQERSRTHRRHPRRGQSRDRSHDPARGCRWQPVVQAAIPALAALAALIGDPHVRNMGTIGGSLANNDPAADYPAAALALGATIVTNKRRIEAKDFFTGLFETALEAGELITKVSFPTPQRAAYQKFRNPASRYALVGVFVAKTAGGVRVAVTGAGSSGVFRAERVRSRVEREFLARSARWRFGVCERPQFRSPRRRRLSGAPHRGDGETRSRGGLTRKKLEPRSLSRA